MASKANEKKSSGGFSHPDYDTAVLDCFLKKQLQLFPEVVASTPEEAADFLEMCFAVVAKSKREVRQYFDEVGTDIEGEDIFSAAEVFPVGDGRFLIVEG
ncbi:MAG: glyoxalase [Eubacteriales bacterium]|nr:glyoxalase [Eubacteriales bacterium]